MIIKSIVVTTKSLYNLAPVNFPDHYNEHIANLQSLFAINSVA